MELKRGSSICVFCSASYHLELHFHEAARVLGYSIAQEGFKLCYGGSSAGLMGSVADGFLELSEEIKGIIPRNLAAIREIEHPNLKDLVVVETLDERKRKMIEYSDAFIIFAGGYGTLDELLEVLTWKQLNFIDKPIVLINYRGFWNSLLKLMDDFLAHAMIDERAKKIFHVCESSQEAIDYLAGRR